MHNQSLFFEGPGEVRVCTQALPALEPQQVRVQTLLSAISPGTELLIYRGQFPQDLSLDENLSALAGEFSYPLQYGYSAVGRVVAVGAEASRDWLDQLVFAFHPHEQYFNAAPQDLMLLPSGLSPEEAVFLPNMETAVNFVMDGAPLIGEGVLVFGQGIVGLLTVALLARYPLCRLVTFDRYPLRRQASLQIGAHASFDPGDAQALEQVRAVFGVEGPGAGPDLIYELSGAPEALDSAIQLAGYAARLVVGSWYGQKRATLNLGGRFHRSRLRLISSQVSSLAPEFSGRWNKTRRFGVAWEMLRLVQPSRLITHRFPLQAAPEAYALLAEQPGEAIQVVFTYRD